MKSLDFASLMSILSKQQFLIGAFIFSMSLSCTPSEIVKFNGEEIEYHRSADIGNISLDIDSLENKEVIFSGSGIWKIFNGQIILADKKTGIFYVFSDDLSLKETQMGTGEGPNQIKGGLVAMAPGDQGLFLLGGSYDYYVVDKNWTISQTGNLDFYHENTPYDELLKNPKPEYSGIYELHYEFQKPSWFGEERVIIQISSTHPDYNYILNKSYFEEAKNLGILDLSNGKIQISGGYPPIYSESNFISYLMGTAVAPIENRFFVQGFEADSLLYKFTADGMLQYAFGHSGKDMMTNYPDLNALDVTEFDLGREELRPKVNYYTTLDFIEERELLVRGYTKNSAIEDGIQLYRNDTLLLDQAVPKGFNYFGYKEPYLYGSYNKQFEREEKIVVYRLKLSE
ncbi:hypothetical protein E4S40_15675 [Algoriphagus kandeliae]|uniref:DUF4221 domain-containing protein n=1 Tax=Algoriphagus kandeliae TaxID=2562278 RepID=A0A4Y9QLV0_9BACT|nr:hypothetical protein [Algoriphagus kandeliae]TFV93681.1 hypothetical protein E4S40_15675 [Algoriphagus kandeliae]